MENPENIGYDEWMEKLDAKIYLFTGDRLTETMRRHATKWYFIRLFSLDKALLEWLRLHPIG